MWQTFKPHTSDDAFVFYPDSYESADVNARCQTLIHYSLVFPKSPPDLVQYCRHFEITVSEHTLHV